MNKSVVVILGIIAAAIIGYLVFQDGAPAVGDEMPASDTMPAGEVMNDDDSMVGGDAAVDVQAAPTMDNTDAEEMEVKEATEEAMEESGASYLAFSDGVIGNGETSVLFFHAAWCPSCRQGDKDLAGIYGKGNAKINTYKVDYDTSDALKQKYGVTYQHTFVKIDGQGNVVKILQGANAAQLEAMING